MGNATGTTNIISATAIGLTIGIQFALLSLLNVGIILFRPDITDVPHRVYDYPGVNATYDFIIIGAGSAGKFHLVWTY